MEETAVLQGEVDWSKSQEPCVTSFEHIIEITEITESR